MFLFELIATLTAVFVALAMPATRRGAFWPAWRLLRQIGARRRLSIGLVFLASLGINALASALSHPVPRIHDEFSYLLAADTYAQGRWTNPTHPHWRHFESFHIIHQPSYASKYPPGNGLLLAAGQAFAGDPIVGSWLGMALACGGLCWMLQAWTRPTFALLGGLLAAVHSNLWLLWGQTYWGGSLAMFGGVLMYGALRRLIARPRVSQSLLLGCGLFLLAIARPYEGLVASLPVGLVLLRFLAGHVGRASSLSSNTRQAGSLSHVVESLGKVVLPPMAMLGLTLAFLAWHNAQVTRDPWVMPYQVHSERYDTAPVFRWQNERHPPTHGHAVMRDFYRGWPLQSYRWQQTAEGFAAASMGKLFLLWRAFLGPVLTLSLLALPWALRRPWTRFAAAALVLELAALAVEVFLGAHYAAPVTGLIFVVLVESLRQLRVWRWRGLRLGRSLAMYVVVITSISCALNLYLLGSVKATDWGCQRAAMQSQLEATAGRHLVIVHYAPEHNVHNEWVYNRADIDAAKVVWARAMSPTQDQELINYFQDRQVWELDADLTPPRLRQAETLRPH